MATAATTSDTRDTTRALWQRRIARTAVFLILALFSFVILFPFYWVVRTAVMPVSGMS